MDQKTINKISREVYRQFPEVSGSSPTARAHGVGQTLLVFHGQATLPGGRTMKRAVRVVADDQGNILKLTTSR